MDWRMIEAAQTGNMNVLYELIQEDPYLLERIDQVPFVETPLHVAAGVGHVDFVMEMMNLKPSFARKLNQAGFSPMHLALQNNKIQAVLRLLKVDKGLVRVKGREGMTPLHHAVCVGNLELLIKFLEVCPEAIEDVTVRDETAFHIAVKNDMFEAFQVLMGWLRRSRHEAAQGWEKELPSWVDIEGNTVLHIAAIRNRPQVVKLLLENFRQDHINVKNFEGLTALDMLKELRGNETQVDNGEIKNLLSKAGASHGSLLPNIPNLSNSMINSFSSKMSCFQKFATMAARGRKGISLEMRNAFLVVTVLIITATYTASLNPPKKENPPGDDTTSDSILAVGSAPTDSISPAASVTGSRSIVIGLPDVYSLFWLYNTLTFWASTGLTAYLLPSSSISLFLLITLSLFGSCYTLLTVAVSSDLLSYYQVFMDSSSQWYYSLSVVNYVFSSLLSLLVAYRIARYLCFKFAVSRLKFLIIILFLSFVFIAAVILIPAMLFTEYMWQYFFFQDISYYSGGYP